MSRNETAGLPRQDRAWVTAAEWFAGGQRIGYDPESARVLTEEEAAGTPGALRVFERVARQIAVPPVKRVPQAEVLTFSGGHLTASEHPDLLAVAIRDIAARHGVGTPAAARR